MLIRFGDGAGEPAVSSNGRVSFDVELNPAKAWHRCLIYDLIDGKSKIVAPKEMSHSNEKSKHADKVLAWQRDVLNIKTSNEEFYRSFHQSVEDMAALRLPLKGTDHMVFVPAAGLPWFVALFGRDTLIASLQTMIVYPEFAAGTLEVLGQYQAKKRDDYRDAQPGKILHELRYGELAHFKLIPHTPYYGTADATPLYLIALHAAWQATGDRSLIERHLKVAKSCLTWIDKYGDADGDGFQEYQTYSTAGYENMGWKDSGPRSCMRTEPSCKDRKRSVNCRATFTTPGFVWPKSTMNWKISGVPIGFVERRTSSFNGSTKHFGMKRPAFMLMRSTVKKRRCSQWRPMSDNACGQVSLRQSAPGRWLSG